VPIVKMFIPSSSSANRGKVWYLSVQTLYPEGGFAGSFTKAEHNSVTACRVFKRSGFPFSALPVCGLEVINIYVSTIR
jgi:hypothetical protein